MGDTDSMSSPLSDDDRAQLSARADEFHEALRKGAGSDWKPFLADLPERMRRPVLIELVIIDLIHRWENRERPEVEDYLAKFPELGPRDQVPGHIIVEECRCRAKAGEQYSVEALSRSLPGAVPAHPEGTGGDQALDHSRRRLGHGGRFGPHARFAAEFALQRRSIRDGPHARPRRLRRGLAGPQTDQRHREGHQDRHPTGREGSRRSANAGPSNSSRTCATPICSPPRTSGSRSTGCTS